MVFMDVELPVKISLGTSGGVTFQTDVVVYGSGREYRNSRWDYQKSSFDVSYVVKNRADAIEVYNFFLAAKGRFNTFRATDYLDHSSAADGVSTPTSLDQVVGIGDGSTVTYQTTKTYSNGITDYTRRITKPVDNGTFKVAIDGVEQAPASFTVDYTTGTIQLGTVPALGQIVTAGFEFSVHSRFNQDTIQGIQYIFLRKDSDRDNISFPPLEIVEVID